MTNKDVYRGAEEGSGKCPGKGVAQSQVQEQDHLGAERWQELT
jgi:hypothetical protein